MRRGLLLLVVMCSLACPPGQSTSNVGQQPPGGGGASGGSTQSGTSGGNGTGSGGSTSGNASGLEVLQLEEMRPPLQTATLAPIGNAAHPNVDVLPDPSAQGGHVGRMPRRLSVAQLKASILGAVEQQWAKLDEYAPSLGQPDFAFVNDEGLDANIVFAKFLQDGAREVCLTAAAADIRRVDGLVRVLSPKVTAPPALPTRASADEVSDNLDFLALRFWGLSLEPAEKPAWVRLYQVAAAKAEAQRLPQNAWAAVCVALMIDERFISY